jgi:hypothetical protein
MLSVSGSSGKVRGSDFPPWQSRESNVTMMSRRKKTTPSMGAVAMRLSRLTLDLDVLQSIFSTMMMSGIDDRERRSEWRRRKKERRERTTTYIDEKHEFCSKSKCGVSADIFVYFMLFLSVHVLTCLWLIVVFCRSVKGGSIHEVRVATMVVD